MPHQETGRLVGQVDSMDDLILSIKGHDRCRPYAHFDRRVSLDRCADKVTSPAYVAKHSFFPLIENDQRRMKKDEDGNITKCPRPIRYAAHFDSCIYRYYSAQLNLRYNEWAVRLGFDASAIAYRNNHPGMSNIQYASRAFDYIRKAGRCRVLTSDFSDFFESLDHHYLKQQLRTFFPKGMPADYYRVFKSATRYSVVDIRDLLEWHGLPYSRTGVARLNRKFTVIPQDEFKEFAKGHAARPWKIPEHAGRGIPQGLPVSGVLANIYMMGFDERMAGLAREHGALYMRYSDDLIVACASEAGYGALVEEAAKLCRAIPGLEIQESKTAEYSVSDGRVVRCGGLLDSDGGGKLGTPTKIDYLGFSFDGSEVRVRQKAITRYYRRSYRAISNLYSGNQRPSRKRVRRFYLTYSSRGAKPAVDKKRGVIRRGNFITYVNRAVAEFPGDPITVDTKRHYEKFHKRRRMIEQKKLINLHSRNRSGR